MTIKVFEAALGIADPWFVGSVNFDAAVKVLTVPIDFKLGSRFAISGHQGVHPVHDTVTNARTGVCANRGQFSHCSIAASSVWFAAWRDPCESNSHQRSIT